MQALVSIRNRQVSAHCESTYMLLAAYAKGGHIELDPYVNVGATSALLVLSDLMEAMRVEGWDDWSAETLETACVMGGCREMLPFIARTLLAFREWLFATERASDRRLAELRRFVGQLPDGDTWSGEPIPQGGRAYRRAARSEARRMHRKPS